MSINEILENIAIGAGVGIGIGIGLKILAAIIGGFIKDVKKHSK